MQRCIESKSQYAWINKAQYMYDLRKGHKSDDAQGGLHGELNAQRAQVEAQ